MAAFCELPDVLTLICEKTEIYYDAQRDVVGEQMQTDDLEDWFPLSASLDKHQKFIVANHLLKQKERELKAQSTSNNTNNASSGNAMSTAAEAPKMKVIQFKPSKSSSSSSSTSSTTTSSSPTKTNNNNNTSNNNNNTSNDSSSSSSSSSLSSSLSSSDTLTYKHEKIDLIASGRFQQPFNITSALSATLRDIPSNLIHIRVFLPPEYGEPVAIRVQDNATISNVIRAVVQKYSDLARTPALTTDINSYELRMAESDGTPDEDLPKLNHNGTINRRLGTCFALSIVESGGDGAPKKRGAIRMNLPNNQKTILPYQPNQTIGDIVRKLCVKRGWNVADYHCRIGPNETELGSSTTLADLDTDELYLCTNAALVSHTVEDIPDTSIYGYYNGQIQFTCFNVRLIKTFGGKEERVLGLDADNITLSKTNKKGGSVRSQRNINEVAKITLSNRVNQFAIEWTDGKQDRFEADTDKLAREIVTKIEFIKEKREQR